MKQAATTTPDYGHHALISAKAIIKKLPVIDRPGVAVHIIDGLLEIMPQLRAEAEEIDAANRPPAVARNGKGRPIKSVAPPPPPVVAQKPVPKEKPVAKVKVATKTKAKGKTAAAPKKTAKAKPPARSKKANGKSPRGEIRA